MNPTTPHEAFNALLVWVLQNPTEAAFSVLLVLILARFFWKLVDDE